jgi:Ca2+-binding EF-hand superfamily protein
MPVNQNDIDDFIDVWKEFDVDGKGIIDAHELERFILKLANV